MTILPFKVHLSATLFSPPLPPAAAPSPQPHNRRPAMTTREWRPELSRPQPATRRCSHGRAPRGGWGRACSHSQRPEGELPSARGRLGQSLPAYGPTPAPGQSSPRRWRLGRWGRAPPRRSGQSSLALSYTDLVRDQRRPSSYGIWLCVDPMMAMAAVWCPTTTSSSRLSLTGLDRAHGTPPPLLRCSSQESCSKNNRSNQIDLSIAAGLWIAR
jgi:hypothetical protein